MASSPKKKVSKPAKAKGPAEKDPRSKAPTVPAKSAKKATAKSGADRKATAPAPQKAKVPADDTETFLPANNHKAGKRLDAFTRAQKEKLLQLRDAMVDSMAGVAKDNLRSRAEGSEASAF